LKDVGELPSMEEFEKLVAESFQADLIPATSEVSDEPAPKAIAEDAEVAGDVEPAEAQVVEMPIRTGTE